MKSNNSPLKGGFLEDEHTADMALEVWAPSLPDLFITAAIGMFTLSGLQLKKDGPPTVHHFHTQAVDNETLLVYFLSELLFLSERHHAGFVDYQVTLAKNRLQADVTAVAIDSLEKHIKAVTYHDLAIQNEPDGYRVKIVFDV